MGTVVNPTFLSLDGGGGGEFKSGKVKMTKTETHSFCMK